MWRDTVTSSAVLLQRAHTVKRDDNARAAATSVFVSRTFMLHAKDNAQETVEREIKREMLLIISTNQ